MANVLQIHEQIGTRQSVEVKMARVLLEYNGRRVDVKDPISAKAGRPDNSNELAKMVDEALHVLGLPSLLAKHK